MLIGEIGVAFDYERKATPTGSSVPAYQTGDFGKQTLAVESSVQALEANLLSFTWWNYTPQNTNDRGDLWNMEDLSIFSNDQRRSPLFFPEPTSIHAGGRALPAIVRPYARKVCGIPLRAKFAPFSDDRRFELEFDSAAFDQQQQLSLIHI